MSPIHPATPELLRLVRKNDLTWFLVHVIEGVILGAGTQSDADAALEAFLEEPETRVGLLTIVREHGGTAHAEALLKAFVVGLDLKPGCPEEVLHCLGYLAHEPSTELLWRQAMLPNGSRDACLGLLHLTCAGFEAQIRDGILACAGKAVFNEYLPALAIKAGDPELLERIFAFGADASTDCNGGIVLGVALFGDAGLPYFLEILQNPIWEAFSTATGTARWCYVGASHLGLKLSDLYLRQRNSVLASESPEALHGFRVFAALLDLWIHRDATGLKFVSPPRELYVDLWDAFYRWGNPNLNDSVTSRARCLSDKLSTNFDELELRLRIRVEQEVCARYAR